MGTRADFYAGRGANAEWLGSIAWDGYPSGIGEAILAAPDEASFRDAVKSALAERDDGTPPEMGWPWPWDTSHTTDFSYAFDEGAVHGCCFGGPWFDAKKEAASEDDERPEASGPETIFPNMADRKSVASGNRSGLIVLVGA